VSEAKREANEVIGAITEAIRDYHHALDLRESGAAAAWHAIAKIEQILEMPWEQGAEQARRAEKIRSGK